MHENHFCYFSVYMRGPVTRTVDALQEIFVSKYSFPDPWIIESHKEDTLCLQLMEYVDGGGFE